MKARYHPSPHFSLAAAAVGGLLCWLLWPVVPSTTPDMRARAAATQEVKEALKELFARTGTYPRVVDNLTHGLRPVSVRFVLVRVGARRVVVAKPPHLGVYSGRIDKWRVDQLVFYPAGRNSRRGGADAGSPREPTRRASSS